MASLNAISTAIKSIDSKKEDLRKAFEDLQSHSSSLASFTLQWKDLDEHFESIKSSIEERFKKLESIEPPPPQAGDGLLALKKCAPQNTVSNGKQSLVKKEEEESEITPRSELMSPCIKMDWKGLRSYIIDHRKELNLIRDEVAIALKSSPDPAKLVLDAMQGFYPPNSKGDKDIELAAIRRTCILLLEQLTKISPQITPQVKEKAKKLAIEWKGKINASGEYPLEAIAFLQILATYDLASAFDVDELLDVLVNISRRKQAIDLCRTLGFTDKVPDFIQKLTSKGKHLDAVKFVFAFELADKFPPVPILKTYIQESKKTAQEIRKKANHSVASQNEATAKEIAALKAVIKYIEEHKLESEYPRENLEKRMEQLEKQKAERKKRAPATPAAKQQTGNKRPRPSAPANAVAVASYWKSNSGTATTTSNPPIHQTQLQQSSLLPDRAASYYGAAAGSYGLAGQSSLAPPYASSSSGLYGVAENPMSYGGNPSPARSHLYSSDSHPSGLYERSLNPSGLYERSLNYAGYGLPPPQHHPSYYP